MIRSPGLRPMAALRPPAESVVGFTHGDGGDDDDEHEEEGASLDSFDTSLDSIGSWSRSSLRSMDSLDSLPPFSSPPPAAEARDGATPTPSGREMRERRLRSWRKYASASRSSGGGDGLGGASGRCGGGEVAEEAAGADGAPVGWVAPSASARLFEPQTPNARKAGQIVEEVNRLGDGADPNMDSTPKHRAQDHPTHQARSPSISHEPQSRMSSSLKLDDEDDILHPAATGTVASDASLSTQQLPPLMPLAAVGTFVFGDDESTHARPAETAPNDTPEPRTSNDSRITRTVAILLCVALVCACGAVLVPTPPSWLGVTIHETQISNARGEGSSFGLPPSPAVLLANTSKLMLLDRGVNDIALAAQSPRKYDVVKNEISSLDSGKVKNVDITNNHDDQTDEVSGRKTTPPAFNVASLPPEKGTTSHDGTALPLITLEDDARAKSSNDVSLIDSALNSVSEDDFSVVTSRLHLDAREVLGEVNTLEPMAEVPKDAIFSFAELVVGNDFVLSDTSSNRGTDECNVADQNLQFRKTDTASGDVKEDILQFGGKFPTKIDERKVAAGSNHEVYIYPNIGRRGMWIKRNTLKYISSLKNVYIDMLESDSVLI